MSGDTVSAFEVFKIYKRRLAYELYKKFCSKK